MWIEFLAACTRCKSSIVFQSEKGFSVLIRSIRHKGLRRFFESAGIDDSGINPEHTERLSDLLAKLDAAAEVGDMNVPGWHLHPLKGNLRGRFAVKVSTNWRLTFEFADGNAQLVDCEDYH